MCKCEECISWFNNQYCLMISDIRSFWYNDIFSRRENSVNRTIMFSSYSLHWWISKVFQVINLWFQVIDACYCIGVLKRQETEDHPLPHLIWMVFSFPPFRFLFFIPVCPFPNVWEPCGKDEKLASFVPFLPQCFIIVLYHLSLPVGFTPTHPCAIFWIQCKWP